MESTSQHFLKRAIARSQARLKQIEHRPNDGLCSNPALAASMAGQSEGQAMSAEQPPGLTILGRCTNGLRLVSWWWGNPGQRLGKPAAKGAPKPARERLRGLAPWRSKLIEATPVEPPTR